MKVLYGIQLTGNGHVTRSTQLIKSLIDNGFQVDIITSGNNSQIKLPFKVKKHFQGISMYYNHKGGIDWRLTFKNANVKQFFKDIKYDVGEYDLIISNPPFYTEDYKTENEQRDLARFSDALPFEDLVEAAHLLLSENGIFAVIIPFKEEEKFIALAYDFELHPFKITRVKGTPTTEIKRSLLAFSKTQKQTLIDELIIETARHQYTEEYIDLTKDFYLKM